MSSHNCMTQMCQNINFRQVGSMTVTNETLMLRFHCLPIINKSSQGRFVKLRSNLLLTAIAITVQVYTCQLNQKLLSHHTALYSLAHKHHLQNQMIYFHLLPNFHVIRLITSLTYCQSNLQSMMLREPSSISCLVTIVTLTGILHPQEQEMEDYKCDREKPYIAESKKTTTSVGSNKSLSLSSASFKNCLVYIL